jgi:hypothetical protein
MRAGPLAHNLESFVQQFVVNRLLYPRLVLPASHELDNHVRVIVLQCVRHSIGLKQQGFEVDTAAAMTLGSQEESLGLGLADPAAAATVQDYRQILEGTNSGDDFLAAATWRSAAPSF